MKRQITIHRSTTEKAISVLLMFMMSAFFIAPVTMSAAPVPIGQLLTTGGASLAHVESTVFNGDTVSTGPDQVAAVTLRNAGLLNFVGSSTARVEQIDNDYLVGLKNGGVLFASTDQSQQGLKILSNDVQIFVPRSTSATGKVFATARYVMVSATKGTLHVVNQGKTFAMNAGETNVFPTTGTSNWTSGANTGSNYNEDEQQPGSSTGKKKGGGGLFGLSTTSTVLLFTAAGVGTGLLIWGSTKSEASPSKP